MKDDREVSCYALVLRHHAGDDGGRLLVPTLYAARQFGPPDVWLKARQAAEGRRLNAARQALVLPAIAP